MVSCLDSCDISGIDDYLPDYFPSSNEVIETAKTLIGRISSYVVATPLVARISSCFTSLTPIQLKIGLALGSLVVFSTYKVLTRKVKTQLSLGAPEDNIKIIISRPSRVEKILVDDALELYERNKSLESSSFRCLRKNICKVVAGIICGLIPVMILGGALVASVYAVQYREAILNIGSRVYQWIINGSSASAGLGAAIVTATALGYRFFTSEAGQHAIAIVIGNSFTDSFKMGTQLIEEWYDDETRQSKIKEHQVQIASYMKLAFDEMAQHLMEKLKECSNEEDLRCLKKTALNLKDALNNHTDHIYENAKYLKLDIGKVNDMTINVMVSIGKINSFHPSRLPQKTVNAS